MADFLKAFQWTNIENEGGAKVSPEGPTRFGLDRRANASIPIEFYESMSAADAQQFAFVYSKREYWNKHNLGLLDSNCLAMMVYDCAFDPGPTLALGQFQRIINDCVVVPIAVDGAVGMQTVSAANGLNGIMIAGALACWRARFWNVTGRPNLAGLMNRARRFPLTEPAVVSDVELGM